MQNSNYVCVIVDYLDKKIVDVLPSRRKYDLLNYFMLIPPEERNKVKYVVKPQTLPIIITNKTAN